MKTATQVAVRPFAVGMSRAGGLTRNVRFRSNLVRFAGLTRAALVSSAGAPGTALLGAAGLLGAGLLGLGGCDTGDRALENDRGPEVNVVGFNVGPNHALAVDGEVQIAFDRFIAPYTAIRQSLLLRDAFGQSVEAPVVAYDPVTRIISLRDPGSQQWLKPDQFYTVLLGIPDGNAELGGVRSVDGAILSKNTPLRIGFFARAASTPAVKPAAMAFCRDVFPVLSQKCGGGGCHGSSSGSTASGAMGLILETEAGIAAARGRVARQANTGPKGTSSVPAPRVFGIDMPLIDPGSPGTSWLLYKTLLGPEGTTAATSQCGEPTPISDPQTPFRRDVGDAERARLGDVMTGGAMPLSYAAGDLTFDEARRLSRWIAEGASVESCGTCALFP